MAYGRTGPLPAGVRDQPLIAAGSALLFVGTAETVLGALLFMTCNYTVTGECVSGSNAWAGEVLGVAGFVVLLVGLALYLLGRRPRRE